MQGKANSVSEAFSQIQTIFPSRNFSYVETFRETGIEPWSKKLTRYTLLEGKTSVGIIDRIKTFYEKDESTGGTRAYESVEYQVNL